MPFRGDLAAEFSENKKPETTTIKSAFISTQNADFKLKKNLKIGKKRLSSTP